MKTRHSSRVAAWLLVLLLLIQTFAMLQAKAFASKPLFRLGPNAPSSLNINTDVLYEDEYEAGHERLYRLLIDALLEPSPHEESLEDLLEVGNSGRSASKRCYWSPVSCFRKRRSAARVNPSV